MIDIESRYIINKIKEKNYELEITLFNGNTYKTEIKENELNRVNDIVENILFYNSTIYKILS